MAARAHLQVVKSALSKDVLSESTPLIQFFDLDAFRGAIADAKKSFPSHFFHTLAVKANPTLSIMKVALENGMGFETASIGELTQSLNTGADPSKIVFDSPVKTRRELQKAIEIGTHVNFDNWQELERAEQIVSTTPASSGQWLGLRINPQVGAGAIATHSTGTATSKFGIGLQDDRRRVIEAYKRNKWLNAVHVHVGSQGVGLDLAAVGIRAVVELVLEVNKEIGSQQIKCIDIGGGLGVNFESEVVKPTFTDYAKILQETSPELFTGEFSVITEFGRCIVAKAGWFASRVEYTKVSGGRHIAAQHIGADMAVRTIYHPTIWPLRVTVLDSEGNAKPETNLVEQDVAGPCCIQGDIIAHQRPLPLIEPADILLVHDVGGYYISSYSRYNCRQAPAIYGYEVQNGTVQLKLLQAAETVDESLQMFRMPNTA